MFVKYTPNEKDRQIIETITAKIDLCLANWYGDNASLDVSFPKIRSYKNSFMLRYPFTTGLGAKKTILVKIRRSPKMGTLFDAIHADIHGNIPAEFDSLESVFGAFGARDESFGAIRPLSYMDDYHAILMEEFPSHTLRQILTDQRSAQHGAKLEDLQDAAKKTGRWLHYFQHEIHQPVETEYSIREVLYGVQSYAIRLKNYSQGRISAEAIIDSFANKLDDVRLDSIKVSQSHADLTCDNVLYSADGKVCIIDIKKRPAPIYADLGLILIHPETFKLQILSGGRYLNESVLREYRAALLSGYFEHETMDVFLVNLFSAIRILDKWAMYEELISRYKGWKQLISIAAGPMVSTYFGRILKRQLAALEKRDAPLKIALAETA